MKIGNLQLVDSLALQDTVPLTDVDGNDFTRKATVEQFATKIGATGFIVVESLADLPEPTESGVIELTGDAYLFKQVDLEGNTLLVSSSTVITGTSSETSYITSTGLSAGVPMIVINASCPMFSITLKDVDTAIYIAKGVGITSLAIDWNAVNFLNVSNIGEVANPDNFIYTSGAFLNSKGLEFTGVIGTVAFDNSLFSGNGTPGSILSFSSTFEATRRVRFTYSSFVVPATETGIDIDASAVIQPEGYIIDSCNFAGIGTYLSGINETSDIARFLENRGIDNTRSIGNYYMQNNSEITTISDVGVPVKVEGVTTANSLNRKFDHSDNNLLYQGSLNKIFNIHAVASITSSPNKQIGFYIAKNGVVLPETQMYATTNAGGRFESIAIQGIVELNFEDSIEIWVENATDTDDVVVSFLNVSIKD